MKHLLSVFAAVLLLQASGVRGDSKNKAVDAFLNTAIAVGHPKPDWTTIGDILSRAPAIVPQADGVVFLNVDAAALIRWNNKQAALVNGFSAIRIDNGAITHWDGDVERPTWHIQLPAGGAYRVIINRSTTLEQQGEGAVTFLGSRRRQITTFIDPSTAAGKIEPFEMGEIDLDPGETVVEFQPAGSGSPFSFSHLADIRLIPLDPWRKLARPAGDVMGKMGIDQMPEVALIARIFGDQQKELDWVNKKVRPDFSSFSSFNQFFEFDRLTSYLPKLNRAVTATKRRLNNLRISNAQAATVALAKLNPAERTTLNEYFRLNAELESAETKAYAKANFPVIGDHPPGQGAARKTLFPTGRFEELPRQQIDVESSKIQITDLPPPPDAVQRMERFKQRDNDANLAILCRDLHKVLIPGTPGLEEFERLCAAAKPREALAEYRAYFFAKLADPEAHGAATQNILFELTRDRGKGELFLRPNPAVVDLNLNNVAVAQIEGVIFAGRVGPPGAVGWAPYGLNLPASAYNAGRASRDPFFQTPAGHAAHRTLEFYRYLHQLPSDRIEYFSGGLFPALIWSYGVTGNKAHLSRWCEYLDDWAMNSTRDEDNLPYSIRCATELETQDARCTLNLLRIMLDERPEMALDFDAATLARVMMKLVSDYAPYVIRARRTEMANWGIMGICHQLHLSRFLQEYAAMDYFNREAWRLWNANMIQHRTLDGENFEAWDEGHNWIDIEYSEESIPFAKLPAWVDNLDLTSFWDDVKCDERGKLVHLSPLGNYWPFWSATQPRGRTTLGSRYHSDPAGRNYFDLVDKEPQAAARLQTVLTAEHPLPSGFPQSVSDVAPYAAMYYLRDDWRAGADYFLMQNFRDRSQTQENCSRTMYSLSKSDRILVEAHGLVVDRKPDNRFQDKPRTGGKTEYCGQAGRHVFDERFHASSRFNFAEAKQDAPYAEHRLSTNDIYGLYKRPIPEGDPNPITDVSVLRQTFGVRGIGVWIICDRINAPATKKHEYTQFYSLPLRFAQTALTDRLRLMKSSGVAIVDEDEKRQCIRTVNPGFENVSIYCFAPSPVKFANILNRKAEHEVLTQSPLEMMAAALADGKAQSAKEPIRRPVSVRWNGTGNQVFVTAICTRDASFDIAKPYDGDARDIEPLKGDGGIGGCHLTTRAGTEVWFESGPKPVNRLICGTVRADAESLLVYRDADGSMSGIVLGCTSFAADGGAQAVKTADFEFGFSAKAVDMSWQPILRPIDTARILPDVNAFTDRIDVSFDIPTQKIGDIEFRYTLDASDPTRDSTLYSGPFAIEKTTLVKMRPFRKDLSIHPSHSGADGNDAWPIPGIESGKIVSAIFRKLAPLPAMNAGETEPGLEYAYFEGNWASLFSYAGIAGTLEPRSSGVVASLLDAQDIAKTRVTDRAFAIRYNGFLKIPAAGVYTLYAPPQLYTATMDAGYDLRVFIDGEEWFPNPRLHAENSWSIPLQAGLHRLEVAYTDYRWKNFRNEYWMAWQEEEMSHDMPTLDVSGPSLPKQPVPAAWLRRTKS